MIKRYCDVCGREMLPTDMQRMKLRRGEVRVEVYAAIVSVPVNNGDVCHACIMEVVARYARRERDVELVRE